jgi:pyocin large subunit-like protein
MSRQVLKLVILTVILAGSWFLGLPKNQPSSAPTPITTETRAPASGGRSARETWGRIESLPDHFARHGKDFQARDADDYAAQAAAMLQRAKTTGLPAKRDSDGSLRVFDPATGAFGAYNRDGTTKTFFKPGNADYFDRQPGAPVDLRTAR